MDNNKPTKNAEYAPEGWRSARQLESGYSGGSIAIARTLTRVREEMILQFEEAGHSKEQAEAYISSECIGKYRSRRGMGAATFHAAPAIVDWLEAEGELKSKEKAAPKPLPGWRSASQLEKTYAREGATIDRELWGASTVARPESGSFFRKMQDEIVATGMMNVGIARAFMEEFMAGRRKPRRGPEGGYYSADFIRAAVLAGMELPLEGKPLMVRRDGLPKEGFPDVPNEEMESLRELRQQVKKSTDQEKS